MSGKQFAVYMMASTRRGTIYTGVTSNLAARAWQHRNHVFEDSFTDRYNVTMLVWYEPHATAASAITREKQIKDWRRVWKVELIEATNPRWDDLFDTLLQPPPPPSFRRKPESTAPMPSHPCAIRSFRAETGNRGRSVDARPHNRRSVARLPPCDSVSLAGRS